MDAIAVCVAVITFVTGESVVFLSPQRRVDAVAGELFPLHKVVWTLPHIVLVRALSTNAPTIPCRDLMKPSRVVFMLFKCDLNDTPIVGCDCLYVVLTGLTVQCRRRVQFTLVLC